MHLLLNMESWLDTNSWNRIYEDRIINQVDLLWNPSMSFERYPTLKYAGTQGVSSLVWPNISKLRDLNKYSQPMCACTKQGSFTYASHICQLQCFRKLAYFRNILTLARHVFGIVFRSTGASLFANLLPSWMKTLRDRLKPAITTVHVKTMASQIHEELDSLQKISMTDGIYLDIFWIYQSNI